MEPPRDSRCPMCAGGKAPGHTTFVTDLGSSLIVVREVPATVCAQCGEEWIDAETAASIEEIVEDARRTHKQVEVVVFAA